MTLSEPVQRVIACGLVILFVLLPLSLIDGLIQERWQRNGEVERSVVNDWGEAVMIGAPGVQEWRSGSTASVWIEDDEQTLEVLTSNWRVDLDVQQRRIGIFAVPVYTARVSGAFALSADASGTDWILTIPVSPARSVKDVIVSGDDNQPRSVRYQNNAVKIHFDAPVPDSVSVDMVITGSQSIALDPGRVPSDIEIASNWQHPGFSGFRLPESYSTDASGFTASWPSTSMALFGDTQGAGVRVVTPVDVYSLVDRSLKYALFFIALVVGSVFALDGLSGARVHPIQIGMVAAAMAVFYLLLLACSEIVGFSTAFIIATVVLVVQLGWYAQSVYARKKSGAIAAGVLTLLYSAQYSLLVREDYALLLGSILVSLVVGLLLIATRRLHWGKPSTSRRTSRNQGE